MTSKEEAREALEKQKSKSVATRLVQLVLECGTVLYHDAERNAFADVLADGVRQTWPLRSGLMRDWLSRLCFENDGRVPGSQAVADALNVLRAHALFTGSQRPVGVRVAAHEDKIYLDLGDERWRAVEISAAGWKIVDNPPVRFRRPKGLLPLPEPRKDGKLDALKEVCNLAGDAAWRQLVAWLTASLLPSGPYPVLFLNGEQGSAKSTTARVFRSVIDPNRAPLRAEPRDGRDLAIAANNGWLVALDNVSHLPGWLSDAMCRLATGGGFSTRQLYTDDEEMLFDAQRPLLITSICDVMTAGDLLDRAVLLDLLPIDPKNRRTEADLFTRLDAIRPGVLGALLGAVCAGLGHLSSVRLERMPRMADFATWGVAVWRGLGESDDRKFLGAYSGNIQAANAAAMEASPVALAVLKFMEAREQWEGTAAELSPLLAGLVGEAATRQRSWPQSLAALSAAVARSGPALRRAGVAISRGMGRNRRLFTLTKEKVRERASPASPASPTPDSLENPANGRDAGVAASAKERHAKTSDFAREFDEVTRGDAGDAVSQDFSSRGAEMCREWRWESGMVYAEAYAGEAETHPSNAVEWRFMGEQDWHPIHRNGDS